MKRKAQPEPAAQEQRTPLGPPDPLLAAQEACRHAQEGNHKLSLAVESFREALEQIALGERDLATGYPMGLPDMRKIAVAALDQYSKLTGQNWKLKRNKLTGPTLAKDVRSGRANKPVHEREMSAAPPAE